MPQFILHGAQTRVWLTEVIVSRELGKMGPASMDPCPRSLPIGLNWDVRAVGEEDGLALLVHAAQEAGVMSGPPGAWIEFEFVDDGDDGYYRYLLSLSDPAPLTLASPAEEMRSLGDRGASGIDAATALLHEATCAANALLDQLAGFITSSQSH